MIQPQLRLGVLLYGLIRSDKMLERTAQSLEEAVFRALHNQTLTFAHAYCSKPLCSHTATTSSLQNLSTELVSLSLTTTSPIQAAAFLRGKPPCKGPLWRDYLAALWSLRSALEASQLAVPPMDALLTVRVDVQFLPTAPITDFWINRPWAHADRLIVPDWEHWRGEFSHCWLHRSQPRTLIHAPHCCAGINDRFVYGARLRVGDYIEARWRRIQASSGRSSRPEPPPPDALAKAWKLKENRYPTCLLSEMLAGWYVTTRNITLGFSAAKFVRVRADLQIPATDRALVSSAGIHKTSLAHQLCPSLKCSTGDSDRPTKRHRKQRSDARILEALPGRNASSGDRAMRSGNRSIDEKILVAQSGHHANMVDLPELSDNALVKLARKRSSDARILTGRMCFPIISPAKASANPELAGEAPTAPFLTNTSTNLSHADAVAGAGAHYPAEVSAAPARGRGPLPRRSQCSPCARGSSGEGPFHRQCQCKRPYTGRWPCGASLRPKAKKKKKNVRSLPTSDTLAHRRGLMSLPPLPPPIELLSRLRLG